MKTDTLSHLIMEEIPKIMDALRFEMRKNANLECDDLTIPQFRILNRLSKSPELLSTLSKWLGVSKPTASVMVNNLIKRKLVQRVVNPDDKRAFTLCCTKEGSQQIKMTRDNVQLQLTKKLNQLTKNEQEVVIKAMALLKGCLL